MQKAIICTFTKALSLGKTQVSIRQTISKGMLLSTLSSMSIYFSVLPDSTKMQASSTVCSVVPIHILQPKYTVKGKGKFKIKIVHMLHDFFLLCNVQ